MKEYIAHMGTYSLHIYKVRRQQYRLKHNRYYGVFTKGYVRTYTIEYRTPRAVIKSLMYKVEPSLAIHLSAHLDKVNKFFGVGK